MEATTPIRKSEAEPLIEARMDAAFAQHAAPVTAKFQTILERLIRLEKRSRA